MKPANGVSGLKADPFAYWLCVLGTALAYYLAGRLGLAVAMVGALITLVWLPSGIAVAVFFRWGTRYWPGVFVGAVAVNFVTSQNAGLSLAIGIGNTLAPMLAAQLLKNRGFDYRISRVQDVVLYVLAAFASMLLSASCGILVLWWTQTIPASQLGLAWFTWWLGDAVGVILGGVALISCSPDNYRMASLRANRPAIAVAVAWLALICVSWVVVPADPVRQILALTFPVAIVVWVAFRLGASQAALAVLLLAGVGSAALLSGRGPFIDVDPYLAITKFWAYMNTVAIVSLLVSALHAEREATTRQLNESEAKFRDLTRLSSDWYWEQDADFRFTRMEGQSKLGEATDFSGRLGKCLWEESADALTPGEWDLHKATLAAHLPYYDLEIQLGHASAGMRWLSLSGLPVRNKSGKFLGYRGVGKDITKRKRAEEEVRLVAHFDQLTGLPNRTLFMQRLEADLSRARRNKAQVAVLLLDLDHFKNVNDTMGHDQGDLLLLEASRRIKACLRESDTFARLGGDEFCVVLDDVGAPQNIETIATKINQVLGDSFALPDGSAYVSTSIGIALFPGDGNSIDELLKCADQAMYAAKDAGRGTYSFYTPELQANAQHRLWLTRELHKALEQGHFWMAYQPIIELKTGKCRKAEALIRWDHPTRGPIGPGEFIPVAESCGLIIPIGDWVIRQAILQVHRCRALFGEEFQISVNKSPTQIANRDPAYRSWRQLLQASNMPGNAIVAEITEGLLLTPNAQVSAKLEEFRDAGIQVALDDFGTGYSSLAYLQKFDIDYLKIDQAFVRQLGSNQKTLALCEAMIVMAHKLGLQVVAEGVETEQQWQALLAADCDFGQGYFFARPMRAEAMERMVRGVEDSEQSGAEQPVWAKVSLQQVACS